MNPLRELFGAEGRIGRAQYFWTTVLWILLVVAGILLIVESDRNDSVAVPLVVLGGGGRCDVGLRGRHDQASPRRRNVGMVQRLPRDTDSRPVAGGVPVDEAGRPRRQRVRSRPGGNPEGSASRWAGTSAGRWSFLTDGAAIGYH